MLSFLEYFFSALVAFSPAERAKVAGPGTAGDANSLNQPPAQWDWWRAQTSWFLKILQIFQWSYEYFKCRSKLKKTKISFGMKIMPWYVMVKIVHINNYSDFEKTLYVLVHTITKKKFWVDQKCNLTVHWAWWNWVSTGLNMYLSVVWGFLGQ